MEESLSLNEAGRRLGVPSEQLKRLIRVGNLPEAQKVRREGGAAWVVPTAALESIASREGWVIDVRNDRTVKATAPVVPPMAAHPPAEASPPSVGPADANETATTPANKSTPPTPPPRLALAKPPTSEASKAPSNRAAATPPPSFRPPSFPMPSSPKAASAKPSSLEQDRETLEAKPLPPTPTEKVTEKATEKATALETQKAESRREELALAEIIDAALLDRLLGAHEEKAEAVANTRSVTKNLAETKDAHKRTTEMLEIERRERNIALDRFRQEQTARYVADAKVAELRDRLVRDMATLDGEKQARVDATRRSLKAEREAATAMASMGWVSRRRFRRINDRPSPSQD